MHVCSPHMHGGHQSVTQILDNMFMKLYNSHLIVKIISKWGRLEFAGGNMNLFRFFCKKFFFRLTKPFMCLMS